MRALRLPWIIPALLLTAGGLVPAAAAAADPPSPLGEEAYRLLVSAYDYDPGIPLEARVVERKDHDDGIQRKVVFRGARGFLVSGYLELPTAGKPPYPCMLLVHGWSGAKDNWWDDGNYISGGETRDALLAKGIAVFALDAQAHGDRNAENDFSPVNTYNEPGAAARKGYFTLREIVMQTVVDYRRGLDYLASRGDIEMSRVGVWGYSMGGFQAFALTAVEPRVKLAVACVAPKSWSQDAYLDPANYARGIGKRPFLMLVGSKDELCSEEQGRALYRLVESPQTRLIVYDSGHRLPVEYVKDALPFVAEHL